MIFYRIDSNNVLIELLGYHHGYSKPNTKNERMDIMKSELNLDEEASVYEFSDDKRRLKTKSTKEMNCLVKDKRGRARGDGDSTTIGSRTGVYTILQLTVTIDGGTFVGDNLDVVVWWGIVVWVWNDGQVSDTVSVAGAKNHWSPVSDTGTGLTPNTTIFNRHTSVVDVVLS